jgi:putative FmdB family regulatory protein
MPIYCYKCKNCERVFDHLQLSTTSEQPKCPDCSSELLERQFHTASFHNKGSGWAKDGYGGNGRKKQ